MRRHVHETRRARLQAQLPQFEQAQSHETATHAWNTKARALNANACVWNAKTRALNSKARALNAKVRALSAKVHVSPDNET